MTTTIIIPLFIADKKIFVFKKNSVKRKISRVLDQMINENQPLGLLFFVGATWLVWLDNRPSNDGPVP